MLRVYVDGSCRMNPGPGGYAVVFYYPEGRVWSRQSVLINHTTNNRMELMAFITAILGSKGAWMQIFTDSQYVYNIWTRWLEQWNDTGKVVKRKNIDLLRILTLLKKKHGWRVRVFWIRGHSNLIENDLVDRLAKDVWLKSLDRV